MISKPQAPGDRLREELEARHMSQSDLARRMGRPLQVVSEIINRKKALTEETALELEKVLGVPAADWVTLEAEYQLALARRVDTDELRAQVSWLTRFPVREMERRGWIGAAMDPADKVGALLQFFGVASFNKWEEHQEALGFRITGSGKVDTGALAVWVRRGEVEAQALSTAEYSEQRFRHALEVARSSTRLAPRTAWQQVQEACAGAGVAAIVVKEFPKIGANGVARWLSPKKAMIQLNLRYKWSDVFWFTFFHEAAHIIMHEPKRIFVEIDGDPHRDPKETQANSLAEELLIPAAVWESFVLHTEFDAQSVKKIARKIGIHPGIIIGRLQHLDLLPWSSSLNSLRDRLTWTDGPT